MRISKNLFYSSSIVLVLFTTLGQSLMCYQCSTRKDPRCINPEIWGRTFYKECKDVGDKVAFCRKIVQNIIKEEDYRVHRECGHLPGKSIKLCHGHHTELIFDLRCVCYTDGCNSAPRIRSTWVQWVLLIIVILANTFLRRN